MAAGTKAKEPTKRATNGSREAAKQAPRAQTASPTKASPPSPAAVSPMPARADGEIKLPDLGAFGVSERDARAHLAVCESCGRASRHVAKNPKDVTALQHFGRNLSACLAVNAPKPATAVHAAQ
jgi:hypothetical protein